MNINFIFMIKPMNMESIFYYLDDFAARIKAKSAATKKPAAKKLNNADDLFDSMLGEDDKKQAASKLPAASKPAPKPAAAKRPKITDSDLDDMEDSDGSADYKPKKVNKLCFRLILV